MNPLPDTLPAPPHPAGQHNQSLGSRLNALRAGVLGANDGIISIAGLVIGVAGATADAGIILISGLAGLVAGALSMAGGEYVSVSTQRDTEKAAIAKETWELQTDYAGELRELAQIYQKKGLSEHLAKAVATELMNKDALAAHAEAELNIDPTNYVNPWAAAFFSLCAFTAGALLPLLAIVLLPETIKIAGTFITVLFALALTGYVSAGLGGAPKRRAILRNMIVGAMTMGITYGVGGLIA